MTFATFAGRDARNNVLQLCSSMRGHEGTSQSRSRQVKTERDAPHSRSLAGFE
jgi:hypothetical protein